MIAAERIIQLRMPGFVDIQDIKQVISMIYESCIILNYSEKETNNSLIYKILNSFYKEDGVEKTTKAEVLVKKNNTTYGKYFYKYINVYCDIDNCGIDDIDNKLKSSGYTKLSLKMKENSSIDTIKTLYRKVGSLISEKGGYILDINSVNGKKTVNEYETVKHLDIDKYLDQEENHE